MSINKVSTRVWVVDSATQRIYFFTFQKRLASTMNKLVPPSVQTTNHSVQNHILCQNTTQLMQTTNRLLYLHYGLPHVAVQNTNLVQAYSTQCRAALTYVSSLTKLVTYLPSLLIHIFHSRLLTRFFAFTNVYIHCRSPFHYLYVTLFCTRFTHIILVYIPVYFTISQFIVLTLNVVG